MTSEPASVGRYAMVHRLAAGTAAAVLLVTALALPVPGPDCVEWCRIDQVLLVFFAALIGWPAVVPDAWMPAVLPASILVAATAWVLGTSVHGPGMVAAQWTAAGIMVVHWGLWRFRGRADQSLR